MNIKEKCPKCGGEMEAEFVDIGIGYSQVSEAFCVNSCDMLDYFYADYVRQKEKLGEAVKTFDEWLKEQMGI